MFKEGIKYFYSELKTVSLSYKVVKSIMKDLKNASLKILYITHLVSLLNLVVIKQTNFTFKQSDTYYYILYYVKYQVIQSID